MDYLFSWDFWEKVGIIVSIVGVPILIMTYYQGYKKLIKLLQKEESYSSNKEKGIIEFNYSDNDGVYTIGSEDKMFDIHVSKASKTDIYLYRHGCTKAIAHAEGFMSISKIKDTTIFNTSSQTRTIPKGGVAILKNNAGNYAAIHIIDIKDNTRGDEYDSVTFQYIINDIGVTNFS